MSSHLSRLLDIWYPLRSDMQWVLASVIGTSGSAYRKAGAMMLINDLGQYYGMLSGGCLEEDIVLKAKRCLESQTSTSVVYDLAEDDETGSLPKIGCGGTVEVLCQPVTSDNDFLELHDVRANLASRQPCYYHISLDADRSRNHVSVDSVEPGSHKTSQQSNQVTFTLTPPISILVIGGGTDALPLARIAHEMGWRVTILDPRTRHGRASVFTTVNEILDCAPASLSVDHINRQYDAAVVMSHNLDIDAEALAVLNQSTLQYVALLGPGHRTENVLSLAGLSRDELNVRLASPAGLRLGGELPESIALSIIAEIHAFTERKNALSISGVLL